MEPREQMRAQPTDIQGARLVSQGGSFKDQLGSDMHRSPRVLELKENRILGR